MHRSCETCDESCMEFGRHSSVAQTREVNGRLRYYCCQECGNLDEYAWVKFGMSYKEAKKYHDVPLDC